MKKLLTLVLFGFMFVSMLNAQTGIKGTIVNEYGEPLVGATIHDKTSDKAVQTDFDGNFELKVKSGEHQIEVIFVSYTTLDLTVNVTDGQMINIGQKIMESSAIGIDAIKVIADRAKERETPVAFSDVSKKDIDQQLGSRDIPLVMNVTPSVYATAQGGGAGDARINVRGFNQRNVAIMINGVPVNDMENGWVYWSNWDGLADATSSIQMQRGMSAVNLATPSVGGTMNIITSPAALDAGGAVKFEYGSGDFMKTTLSGNSGLINDKYAVSASVVRKVGTGVIDATWTDAWAYYFGASYQINKKNRLELFAMGAPQRHGQNLYRQNVAAYSTDYANEIGADLAAANITEEGRGWNENWNTVSTSYTGQQFWNGKTRDRFATDFINERENYYHKPVVNLNWYSQWTQKVRQSTVLYYSGGNGGGSGTLGTVEWDYSTPSRRVDWDGTIAENSLTDTAFGILRNSVNEQWTLGALSRVDIHFNDDFKMAAGIDLRTA
ncbi:MAG: TonB-dependent receptor, partial [Bacteroidota bacterium]|nr:TonB-dependent receptor [Bacteroidota bacterium]